MRPEQLYSSPFNDEFSGGPNSVCAEHQAVEPLISTLLDWQSSETRLVQQFGNKLPLSKSRFFHAYFEGLASPIANGVASFLRLKALDL
jgi:hypothetical protein